MYILNVKFGKSGYIAGQAALKGRLVSYKEMNVWLNFHQCVLCTAVENYNSSMKSVQICDLTLLRII